MLDYLKKIARYGFIYPLVISVIIGILVVSFIYWGLGTESGRLRLTDIALTQINKHSEWQIHTTNLRSPKLSTWQLDKLEIYYQDKLTTAATNIEVQWEPEWLLQKKIGLRQLTSKTLDIYFPWPKSSATPETKEAFNPEALPDIYLESLDIAQLSIHKTTHENSIDQQKDTLQLTTYQYNVKANATIAKRQTPQINLTVRSLDKTNLTLAIHSEIDNPYAKTLSVKIIGTLTEDENGFISHLLRLPADQRINAKFTSTLQQENNVLNININPLKFKLSSPKTKKKYAFSLAGKGFINLTTWDTEVFDSILTVDGEKQKIRGKWINNQIDGEITAHKLPLDVIATWVPKLTSGELSGNLKIQGTTSEYTWHSDLTTTTHYNDLPIQGRLIGGGNQDNIDIETLNIRQGITSLELNGHIHTQELIHVADNNDTSDNNIHMSTNKPPIDSKNTLSIKLENFTSQLLLQLPIPLPKELGKSLLDRSLRVDQLDIKANLNGKLKDPDGLTHISASGSYENLPLEFNAELTRKGQSITIKHVEMTAQHKSKKILSTANGRINLKSKKTEITADVKKLPLQLLRIAGLDIPSQLTAEINLKTDIKGTLTSKSIHKAIINADLDATGQYQKIPFSLKATGQHNNVLTRLDKLTFYTFDQLTLAANGEYERYKDNDRIAATLTINQLPPRLISLLKLPLIRGELSSNIHISGSTLQPIIEGDLSYNTTFKSIGDDGEEKDSLYQWFSDIQTQDDQLIIKSNILRDDIDNGNIALTVPIKTYSNYIFIDKFTKPLPTNITLSGDFILSALGFFIDADLHQFHGDAITDFLISGNINEPIINGVLKIEQGSYDSALTGTSVHQLNCTFNAKQNLFTVESCKATDSGKGRLQLAGEVELPIQSNLGRIDLVVTTKNASILRRSDIESEVSGEISINGDFKDIQAKGRLNVAPFTAIIDNPTNANIPSIKVSEVYTTDEKTIIKKTQTSPYLPNITFDLTITADQQAFIRGKGLDAELKGKLRITGTGKNPKYTGKFETKRGRFEIFGKHFDLETGEVTLANDAITLYIVGVYKKNAANTIRAELSGTTDNLKINLTSEPAMAEDEILAFLIFGKSILKITPFEAIRLAMAVQSLRSSGGNFIDPISKTRDLLGVDTLSVDSGEDENGNSGLSLGVGKYINEKVYLELQHTPDPTQPWKGNMQIELSPSLSVESSTGGTTGIEGAELKWKKDY